MGSEMCIRDRAGSSIFEWIADKDDRYSGLIREMYNRVPDNDLGTAVKSAGYLLGGGVPSFRGPMPDLSDNPDRVSAALAHTFPYVNMVPKYVIPGAGVTAAGAGLVELTNQVMTQFGGPADGQSPAELQADPSLQYGIGPSLQVP